MMVTLFANDAGDQEAAELYAKNLLGEELPVRIHPLLLSAEKIEEIKRPGLGADRRLVARKVGE
jgi:hypothetical protein